MTDTIAREERPAGPLTLIADRAAIRNFLDRHAAGHRIRIDKVEPGHAWVHQTVTEEDLRPGGTISGPTVMALVDGAAYVIVLAHVGTEPLTVTSNLNIHFLRRPEAGYTLEAKASILRRGQRSILAEVTVNSKGRTQPVAHAVVAYAIVGSD
ncbi:PaaI family thioesterase [Alcanivorax sp. MM125-6]|nr:PaaI family thioesterase [Alcanivorax sp. MM125-6]UWN48818.1 hypothetical protein ASALC70_01006 [Alcanivorax sp. ALC70]